MGRGLAFERGWRGGARPGQAGSGRKMEQRKGKGWRMWFAAGGDAPVSGKITPLTTTPWEAAAAASILPRGHTVMHRHTASAVSARWLMKLVYIFRFLPPSRVTVYRAPILAENNYTRTLLIYGGEGWMAEGIGWGRGWRVCVCYCFEINDWN